MNRFNFTTNDHAFPQNRFAGQDRLGNRSPLGRPLTQSAQPDAQAESEVRWDLIRRLRQEIAAGTYASPQRWQQAVAGLSDELAG